MKKEKIKSETAQPLSPGFQLVETSTGSLKPQMLPGGLIRPIPQWTHTGDHLHQPALRRLSRGSAA